MINQELREANLAIIAVLVEQFGVLATLSRLRSRVQIPPRTFDGTVRKPGKAAKLKPW